MYLFLQVTSEKRCPEGQSGAEQGPDSGVRSHLLNMEFYRQYDGDPCRAPDNEASLENSVMSESIKDLLPLL